MTHPLTRFHGTHVMTPRPYDPHGYVGAAFKETVLGEGVYEVGYVTGWEADLMIGRAAAKRRPIHAREYGALSLSGRRRCSDIHRTMTTSRSRTLELVVHPKKLSDRQYEDLMLVDQYEHRARAVHDESGFVAAIEAGLYRIPRTQTSILLGRGWLSQAPHSDKMWISSAGRMAMAWRWHQEQGLKPQLLKGLYVDAALTAASTARASLTR